MQSIVRSLLSWLIVPTAALILAGCNPLALKQKAGLQVITNDTPSSVFLNDQYLDKTPLITKDLKPGQYSLSIRPDDSQLTPYETTVNVRKGLLTVVTWKPGPRPELSGGVIYELEALPNKQQTELSVVSIPDSAIVTLNQSEKEFAPVVRNDLNAGTHDFEATLPSYETQKHTINLVAGHRLNITVKLAKNPTQDSTTKVEATPTPPVITPSPSSAAPNSTSSANLASTAATRSASSKTITVLPTNYFDNGKQVLRVRDQASPAGKELGFIDVGSTHTYFTKSNGWYEITFKNQKGWVSGQFVTEN